jgi:hypothetical protein
LFVINLKILKINSNPHGIDYFNKIFVTLLS